MRLLLHTHTCALFFFRCARDVARPVPQAFADTRFTAFASVPHLLLNTVRPTLSKLFFCREFCDF